MGTLYLVPTPVGNLEDITLRALRTLKEVSLIATEDTRTTGRLLKHFDINRPLVSYFEHNKLARLERVLGALAGGDVALVSEAGTPLLSDPGHELVRAALERGFEVVPLPGPSAITTALTASGLSTDRFLFLGFLPRKAGARQRFLAEIKAQPATLVIFETPHRLLAALADMVDTLGGERNIALCRELTKLHEDIWRGTLAEALETWRQRDVRGEFTLVVSGAAPPPAWNEAQVKESLQELIARGLTSKEAIRTVTDRSGWPKREVYAVAQRLKDSNQEQQDVI